jgi:hypothetical protein
MLPRMRLANGMPSPLAILVDAIMIQAIYRGSRPLLDRLATAIGGNVVRVSFSPQTFEPDTCVISVGNNWLIGMAGTTNKDQWLAHLASGFSQVRDTQTDSRVVQSFYVGEQQVEQPIRDIIGDARSSRVHVSGHSYGAAASFIFAAHQARRNPHPATIDLLTFGEPMSYDATIAGRRPDAHVAIIAGSDALVSATEPNGVDPVSMTPYPGRLLDLGGVVSWATSGATWRHFGNAYQLTGRRLVAVDWFQGIIGGTTKARQAELLLNIPWFQEHYMGSSYLAKALANFVRSEESRGPMSALITIAGMALSGETVTAETRGETMDFRNSFAGQCTRAIIAQYYSEGRISTAQRDALISLLNSSLTAATFQAGINASERFHAWNGIWNDGLPPDVNAQVAAGLVNASNQIDVTGTFVPGAPTPSPGFRWLWRGAAAEIAAETSGGGITISSAVVRAESVVQAVNSTRKRVEIPEVAEAAPGGTLPKEFLASVAKVANGSYGIVIDNEVVATFRSKNVAKSEAKGVNRMLKGLQKSQGFDINQFIGSLGRVVTSASGEEGLNNGLAVPMPGF